jgi:hypothetical protein
MTVERSRITFDACGTAATIATNNKVSPVIDRVSFAHTRAAEVQRDAVLVCPADECVGDELGAIVDPDRSCAS